MTVTLACPMCAHQRACHYSDGRCAIKDCFCVEGKPPTEQEVRAAIRATTDSASLVSHVDDRRNVLVGHYVTEKQADESDYTARAGIVVERWMTDDGEPGVVVVAFARRGRDVLVNMNRLLVANLRDDWLSPKPDPATCAYGSRKLLAAIGQRIDRKDHADPLNDYELRWFHWASALINAGARAEVTAA